MAQAFFGKSTAHWSEIVAEGAGGSSVIVVCGVVRLYSFKEKLWCGGNSKQCGGNNNSLFIY